MSTYYYLDVSLLGYVLDSCSGPGHRPSILLIVPFSHINLTDGGKIWLKLKIHSERNILVDEYKLKSIIIQGLKNLFGETGSAIEVDILKFEKNKERAILRCLSDSYVKVRASLSFISEFQDLCFSFHVNKASSSLLSLLSNSRKYKFV